MGVAEILIGIGSMLIGLAAGWALGINANVQRQVDRKLRAETRFRHPTAADPSAGAVARAQVRAQARAAHARSVFMPERTADGPKLGLTTAEATSGLEALSEAVRHQQRLAAVDRPICGRSVGNADMPFPPPCLRDPGHEGECW